MNANSSTIKASAGLSIGETMRRISAKGVLIGAIVDVVASGALGVPLVLYAMSRNGPSNSPNTEAAAAAAKAAIHGNASLYASQLLVGLACSVLGGYVAARIAKHDELLNGALSAVLCVILGLYAVASGQDSNPAWAEILLFVASPAMGLVGGSLILRQRRGRALKFVLEK